MEHVMRCKLALHRAEKSGDNYVAQASGSHVATKAQVKVQMGAVYHGSKEGQLNSENAIFGEATPHGSFEATIRNPALVEKLLEHVGREFYVDFSLVPVEPK